MTFEEYIDENVTGLKPKDSYHYDWRFSSRLIKRAYFLAPDNLKEVIADYYKLDVKALNTMPDEDKQVLIQSVDELL